MKQNSKILFHVMHKLLNDNWFRLILTVAMAGIFSACGFPTTTTALAAEKPQTPAAFDPAKGFKPAQSDLTAVFLQIAGSLEFYGSPEPYLRHMQAEHARIEAKYQKQQLGDKPRSFLPAYMDAAYFDRFAANWKHMAPQLGLGSLAKTTGRQMQAAINGPDCKGTILVGVFNEHQHQVYAAMTGKKAGQIPGFDSLRASIVKCLRLDARPTTVANLTNEQQAVVSPANDIRAAFDKLFFALDTGLPANDAEKVKAVLLSIVTDVGRMAQSELEAGIVEKSLDEVNASSSPYAAEQETALSRDERRTFAGFLQKARFTKADFSALDQFYAGPYDKLSERGKEELSHRFWGGIQRPR